jgi:hypothetical protein
MDSETLIILLQIGGLLHVGLLAAGGTMTKTVGLRAHTELLPPFLRRLFWVYLGFIGLVLAGFGLLTFLFAPAIAQGGGLARGFCWFLTAFWAARLIVAAFVFDVRPYLTNWFYRAGYWATNAVFVYLLVLYGFAAVDGARWHVSFRCL